MKANTLMNRIFQLQDDYRDLLTLLLPRIKETHTSAALDEIRLFWFRHSNEIQLYLRMWLPSENSYIFTAATYLDFGNNEHLPFLLLGNNLIFDDPLGRYIQTQNSLPNKQDEDFLFEQIVTTIEDNLNLLVNVKSNVLILPVRMFNQIGDVDPYLYKSGEHAFVSLFNNVDSIDDFFSKCTSFDDIMRYVRDDIKDNIIFSQHDDLSLPIEDRFRCALVDSPYIVNKEYSDSYNFFMIVGGPIFQAVDIVFTCIEYECYPYIRYPVTFHYAMLLSKSLADKEHRISSLRFQMAICYLVC